MLSIAGLLACLDARSRIHCCLMGEHGGGEREARSRAERAGHEQTRHAASARGGRWGTLVTVHRMSCTAEVEGMRIDDINLMSFLSISRALSRALSRRSRDWAASRGPRSRRCRASGCPAPRLQPSQPPAQQATGYPTKLALEASAKPELLAEVLIMLLVRLELPLIMRH